MKKILLGLLFVSVLFSACDLMTGKIPVYIDNPTGDDITVTIGEETFEIDAYDSDYVEIPSGENTFVTKVDDEVIFEGAFNATSSEGILNITGSKYVLWNDIYTNNEIYYDMLQETTIEIDGEEYVGDLEVFEGDELFIYPSWDFALVEEWADTIYLSTSTPYGFRSKVYRVEDFIFDYDAMYYGSFDDVFGDMDSLAFDNYIDSLIGAYEADSIAEYEESIQ